MVHVLSQCQQAQPVLRFCAKVQLSQLAVTNSQTENSTITVPSSTTNVEALYLSTVVPGSVTDIQSSGQFLPLTTVTNSQSAVQLSAVANSQSGGQHVSHSTVKNTLLKQVQTFHHRR